MKSLFIGYVVYYNTIKYLKNIMKKKNIPPKEDRCECTKIILLSVKRPVLPVGIILFEIISPVSLAIHLYYS
jgi:hypothetical protein